MAHSSPGITSPREHERISAWLVFQTLAVYGALATVATLLLDAGSWWRYPLLGLIIIAEGIWLDRIYIVAHEAVHMKLFPQRRGLNDTLARLLLLPIAAPLAVYRKIHYFHHGSNRKDPLTAALDSFTSDGPLSPGRRLYYHCVWIFYVYLGGFFIHSLVSILLFLAAPVSQTRKLSPVFNGWKPRMRAIAWIEFLAGLGLHAAVWLLFGFEIWGVTLGLPLAVFAWFWSLLLYIYHYDTTVGPDVRHNVRSLPHHPFFSWLLLNFNEHATHHYDPSIPWHELPARRHELPEGFEENQHVENIWEAIWQQRRGPRVWDKNTLGSKEPRFERTAR